MADRPLETPVLIVGGGPVGLACALLLGRFDVSCLLVERHPATSHHPKAMAVMLRTAELLRQWGVVDAMRAAGVPQDWLRQILFAKSLTGEAFGTLEVSACEPTLLSPAQALRCPQTATEAVLRRAAQQSGRATLRFGTEMTGLEQDAHGVSATIREVASGRTEMVRARYLLAADGAASGVRGALGIGREGPGDMGHFANIYHRADFGSHLGERKPFMANILSETLGGGYVAVDGRELWLLHVYLEPKDRPEDVTTAGAADLVRRASGAPDVAVEILSIGFWVMSAQIAQHFRERRVLLVGDAAHRTTPAGGLGMNTDLQSAHNLVWKLAAVLNGTAGERLLDTYEIERRPVATLNTKASKARAEGVFDAGAAAARGDFDAIRKWVAGMQRAPDSRLGQDLGYTYESGAIVPDGTPPLERADPIADYVPNARPGARAPHLWLERDGGRLSSLDLFDTGFVLLAGRNGGAWREAAAEVAARDRVRLEAFRVGAGARVDLIDAEGAFTDLYGIGESGAVLVRPDGFVGWRVPSLPARPAAASTPRLQPRWSAGAPAPAFSTGRKMRRRAQRTGVIAPLPANHERTLSSTHSPIAAMVSSVLLAMCGVRTTLSRPSSSTGTCGSCSNTSRPAAPSRPSFRARTSAASSTSQPRATLTKMPSGPMASRISAVTI
jgi:2-polyprenyl-6-methoxyphenol hydroxylase-like FAD-dependent oxidoreductase